MRRVRTAILAGAFLAACGISAAQETSGTLSREKELEILRLENRALKLRNREYEKEKKELGPYLKDAEYSRLVHEIQKQVSTIRGIPATSRLRPVILDKASLARLLDQLLDQELASPKFKGMYRSLVLLELIPEKTDLKSLYGKLLESQVGGLYDDRTKFLYVVDIVDPKSTIGRVILAHEICHALQDMRFPIGDLPFRTDNSDQNLAMSAVLEGDATLAMSEWLVQHGSAAGLAELPAMFRQQMEQDLNSTPPFLVQSLVFPYLAGLQFCVQVQMGGAPDWRTRIFEDPPTSSEQVLHPEKYLFAERDNPKPAPVASLPPKSKYREVFRDVMGEWGTRLFLTPPDKFPRIDFLSTDPLVKEPIALAAAAGWGGDTMVLIENGEEFALVWRTEWDTPRDRDEFRDALLSRTRALRVFAEASPADAIDEVTKTSHSVSLKSGPRATFVPIGANGLAWVYGSSKRAVAEGLALLPPG